jgi:geranylgeranylglycerol-phosphate geranylgeranyltransferase
MILALLQLCRLYYAIPMSLAYLLTVYYARGGAMAGQWRPAAWSTVALALALAGAYALNDVLDCQVDRINAPRRPVASGRVGRAAAAAWAAGLMLLGLAVAAALCRPALLAALAVVTAALLAYDVLSKRLGVLKQVAAAALMTSIYPLAIAQAGGACGPRAGSLAAFPAWLFATSFGYELLKDLRDRAGDPPVAGRPTPLQRDPRWWRRVASLAIAGAAPILLAPALLGCGRVYLAGALAAMALAAVSTVHHPRPAIRLVYAECFLVGLAAAADVVVAGP